MSFPDPATGAVQPLFTEREVYTSAFELDGEELDFYDQLTRYVEDQSIRAAADLLGAWSGGRLYDGHAATPDGFHPLCGAANAGKLCGSGGTLLLTGKPYRQEQITQRLPDIFEVLMEAEQQDIVAKLEDVVASVTGCSFSGRNRPPDRTD